MTTTRTRKIAAALIALTLVGGIAASLPAEAATTATRYVTVNSDGSVKVTPDAVRLNANVSVVAGSNKEALAKTSTSAAAVRAALTAAGIAKADIATQSISVYPEYNYTQDKGSVLVGYRGSQGFVVTLPIVSAYLKTRLTTSLVFFIVGALFACNNFLKISIRSFG